MFTFLMAILFLGLANGCIGPDPENKSAQPLAKEAGAHAAKFQNFVATKARI